MTAYIEGYAARTGLPTGHRVAESTAPDVDQVVAAAASASAAWSARSAHQRAEVLDAVADALDGAVDELVEIADQETGLGASPRLRGEVARTTGQLRLFGRVLREGSYVGAVISPADSTRPDVRRMLRPLGPVAVFAASNFPFAFSVAGGDTASALAAGCPVVVKAHPGHPRTSAETARIVTAALTAAGAPDGTFGIVHGHAAGVALVQHPAIAAVGFTGSVPGGRALFDLAQSRPDPIPFFGELGSINPVVILPRRAEEAPRELAEAFAGSLLMGTGQFCTNPGLLFVPSDAPDLIAQITRAVGSATGGATLTAGISQGYRDRTEEMRSSAAIHLAEGEPGDGPWGVAPQLWLTDAEALVADTSLAEETFGPSALIVTYRDTDQLCAALATVPGSLTGSVHASAEDEDVTRVEATLRPRVGRLVFGGWPTGVAVCWAMHHGGPYPSTTAPAHTSVGATSIARWLAPIAYQDWPDHLLPPELQRANPLGISRITEES